MNSCVKTQPLAVLISIVLVLSGCGGSGDDNSRTKSVDPTSPDEVSAVVFIPGATSSVGTPPPESVSPSRPSINLTAASLPALSGGEPNIEIELSATSAPQIVFAQVEGATDYFSIDLPQSSATSGLIRVPVLFDQSADFSAAGQFCIYVCVQDENGFVSNPGRQCFDALPRSTVQSTTTCYDNVEEEFCRFLRDPSALDVDDGSLQSINFSGSYVRNQRCASVAPGADVTIDSNTLAAFSQQFGLGSDDFDLCNNGESCGACFGVFR